MSSTKAAYNRGLQLLLALPVPAVVIAIDFYVRFPTIANLPIDFKLYYFSSALFSVFIWYALLGWAKCLKAYNRALFYITTFLGSLTYSFIVLAAFAFQAHFGALPNIFAFEYIIDEPRDCLQYVQGALEPMALVALATAAFTLTAYLAMAVRRREVATTKRDCVVTAVVMLGLCGIFNNNVRMGPNAFTPEIHSLFSLSKAVESTVIGQRQVAVVSTGARMPIRANLGSLPHHVLLILNESIRAKSLSAYGYFRGTTPKLSAFFEQRAANIIRFDHAYANATRTMLAFPSFFTGVVPSQTGGLLHRLPSVYDYGRAFANAQTFLISTQSMHWGNFDKFLDTARLNFAWYKEVSEYANTDADRFESLDDKYLPEAFEHFLDQRRAGEKMFGVIQLTNTHAPYGFDKEDDIFSDQRLTNKYDNSLHYHDRQQAKILDMLAKRGLLDDTLIIATSDHGEAFGEHGYYGHLNTFYDEEARVPLWIHLPNLLATNRAVVSKLRANARQAVSNADIIPTLMSLLAKGHYPDLKSQMANLTGMPLDKPLPERAIMLQNYNDIDEKTMFIGLGMVFGRYKYLLKFNQARAEEELYDLEADPREQHNIWSTVDMNLKKKILKNILVHKNSRELFLKAFPERSNPS